MVHMNARFRRLGLIGGAFLLLAAMAAGAGTPPAELVVPLHPRLPETLERDWLDRLGLFPDMPGLQRVRFSQAVWGGLLVRLEIDDQLAAGGSKILVRNLTRDHWDTLQERAAAILAGEDPPPLPLDPYARRLRPELAPGSDRLPDEAVVSDPWPPIRAWPETPPPPAALPRDLQFDLGPVSWQGRWLALIDVGARVNVTGFNSFFTPMGQVGISFGRGLGSRLVPMVGFYAGFGDMRRDFEAVYGDGRSNAFGFSLAGLWRQEVSDRHALYLETGGGYHIRSLYWGGIFYDMRTGQYIRGQVLEQQNWGWHLRVGWLRDRPHPKRPRLLDIGFGVQSTMAERWAFRHEDMVFTGADRDVWLVLSVRFWDGL